ncbi:MAG: hypothetical protein AAFX05_00050 [Planctomycetota bacterium]
MRCRQLIPTTLLALGAALLGSSPTTPADASVITRQVSFIDIARVLDAEANDAVRLARYLGVDLHRDAASGNRDLPPDPGTVLAHARGIAVPTPRSVAPQAACALNTDFVPTDTTRRLQIDGMCDPIDRTLLRISARGPPALPAHANT